MKITKQEALDKIEELKKYVGEEENKEEKVVGIAIKSVFGNLQFQSTKTTFREAILEAVSRGENLSGANLSGAELRDADLRGAELSGADLSDADLSYANLRNANLRNANLSGAELQNAKFYGRGGIKPLKRNQLPEFLLALGFVIED